MGMLFTYVAGWLFNIVLCFVMGDVTGKNSILASPIQQPVAQIFYNVLGKTGGLFFTICALIILKFGNFTAMQSLTRTIFALSRDGLVPFSGIWTKIMPQTGIPILAVWVTVFLCIGINLIGLGSYPAIAGVFNVCAIALDWSYCIPIFCKIIYGKFVPGPWHLGKYSIFINIYACLWTIFVSIIFIMPTILPVTAETVRYSFFL
jgi:amino acid transporter